MYFISDFPQNLIYILLNAIRYTWAVLHWHQNLHGQNGFPDYVDALAHLGLIDDQWRSEANNVAMGGLGQESVLL